jgi:hypothetical protein
LKYSTNVWSRTVFVVLKRDWDGLDLRIFWVLVA